jgi:hypothetical protein
VCSWWPFGPPFDQGGPPRWRADPRPQAPARVQKWGRDGRQRGSRPRLHRPRIGRRSAGAREGDIWKQRRFDGHAMIASEMAAVACLHLGESACSPNLLGRQPRASDGITVHRHAREQHGGGVPVRDSRFPRQSAHLAATGSDTVEIRPEQEADQARSGLPLGRLAPLAGGWNPAGRASISAPRPPHRFVWRSGVLDAATPDRQAVQRGVTSGTAASGGSSSRLMSRRPECYLRP